MTPGEVCRKALERNEKVESGKGDKYCEEVAGNYKWLMDEERSEMEIQDTIVEVRIRFLTTKTFVKLCTSF